ncbi:MAG: hypothetical protein AAGK78_11905, partial [Planctomycetota bacterium]
MDFGHNRRLGFLHDRPGLAMRDRDVTARLLFIEAFGRVFDGNAEQRGPDFCLITFADAAIAVQRRTACDRKQWRGKITFDQRCRANQTSAQRRDVLLAFQVPAHDKIATLHGVGDDLAFLFNDKAADRLHLAARVVALDLDIAHLQRLAAALAG